MRYYSSEKAFIAIRTDLKLMQCPHCKRQGFLVLHGYLYGFGEKTIVKRGRRIFCNNRKMSGGCGKTFSLLLSDWLKGFTIFAKALSIYLVKISEGHTPLNAAVAAKMKMCTSSIYRIHKRFINNQSRIRTFVCRVKPPPHLIETEDPVVATIIHLIKVFHSPSVSTFQQYFQQPFLI